MDPKWIKLTVPHVVSSKLELVGMKGERLPGVHEPCFLDSEAINFNCVSMSCDVLVASLGVASSWSRKELVQLKAVQKACRRLLTSVLWRNSVRRPGMWPCSDPPRGTCRTRCVDRAAERLGHLGKGNEDEQIFFRGSMGVKRAGRKRPLKTTK